MSRTALQKMQYGTGKCELTIAPSKLLFSKEKLYTAFLLILGAAYLCAIIMPVGAIFKEAGFLNILSSVLYTENIEAVKLSAFTTLIAVTLVFVTCTPVVFLMSFRINRRISKVLEIILSLPAVLPPSVAGLGLLLAFGNNGLLGEFFRRIGIDIVFTPFAVILAQLFVASGFYIQVLLTGLRSVSSEILEVSYTLGASKIEAFMFVIIPMLRKTVVAGLLLSWVRAMGEFGATIVFAGNIIGRTQTLPLRIYSLIQTDITSAAAVSFLTLTISFGLLMITKMWIRE